MGFCSHRARAQEGPRCFPHRTHPGFNRTAGRRGRGARNGSGTCPDGHARCGTQPVPASLACAVSTWHTHSCRLLLLVQGPDAQVWAGPAGRPAWARPAPRCRMPGRRDRLGRSGSGEGRGLHTTEGGRCVLCCRLPVASASPRFVPHAAGSILRWEGPLGTVSIPSHSYCKGRQGERQGSDGASTNTQTHTPAWQVSVDCSC